MKMLAKVKFNPLELRALDHEIAEDLWMLRGGPLRLQKTRERKYPVKYFKKRGKENRLKIADKTVLNFANFLGELNLLPTAKVI
jgi:hypothetical protein